MMMTTAYWCVLIAGLMPYVFIVLAKAKPGYSNQRPREFLQALSGWRKRAHWAEQNSFEAFPFFAAGVIIASFLQATQSNIDRLAIAFIIARIFYGLFYILDLHYLRSLAWFIGFGCIICLFLLT